VAIDERIRGRKEERERERERERGRCTGLPRNYSARRTRGSSQVILALGCRVIYPALLPFLPRPFDLGANETERRRCVKETGNDGERRRDFSPVPRERLLYSSRFRARGTRTHVNTCAIPRTTLILNALKLERCLSPISSGRREMNRRRVIPFARANTWTRDAW